MSNNEKRAVFTAWLEQHGLSPYSAAKKAGVSPGAIYNFLSGTSQTLSASVLQKLADATNSTVDSILTGGISRPLISVKFRVGAQGKMFAIDDSEGDEILVALPPGLSPEENYSAALIDGDGLHPIPSGWLVFFKTETEEPSGLIGQMAVVRYSGGGERPVIRTIRKGTETGTFTLQAFNGTLIEDVEIVAVHRIVGFSQSNLK